MRISDWSSDVCSSDLPKPLIACSKQLTCCLGSNVYKIMGFPTLRRRPHKLPAHTVKDHSSTRKISTQLAAQSISHQRAAHPTPLSSSVNTLKLPLHTTNHLQLTSSAAGRASYGIAAKLGRVSSQQSSLPTFQETWLGVRRT